MLEVDYKVPTALSTSIVNVAAIAFKDREYARLFSQSAAVFPKVGRRQEARHTQTGRTE